MFDDFSMKPLSNILGFTFIKLLTGTGKDLFNQNETIPE